MALPLFSFFVVLTLVNVESISLPDLPFTADNVQEYSTIVCLANRNFWTDASKVLEANNTAAFINAFGLNGDFFDDKSVVRIDTKAAKGYDAISYKARIARDLFSFVPAESCEELVNNEYFMFREYWFEWQGINELGLTGVARRSKNVRTKYIFNPKRRTLQTRVTFSDGGFADTVVDTMLTASTTAVSAAQYLGLIEEHMEETEEYIKSISQMFYNLLFVIAVALSVGVCYLISRFGFGFGFGSKMAKKRAKYKRVSINSSSDLTD